ncbi:MAJIN protein, partial [Regulus satrapa]|nr:MAJIN protein [Regulus satrapa]
MKFKHENVHLVPYPYICTLYLELNSFQRNISCGKEVNKGSDELVRRTNEMSESTAMKRKRRRVEVRDDTSCPQSCMNRAGADCVHQMSKAEHGFEKNSSKANDSEFGPASRTKDCDQLSFWDPVEFAHEQKRIASQAEGAVQLMQQIDQTGKKENTK